MALPLPEAQTIEVIGCYVGQFRVDGSRCLIVAETVYVVALKQVAERVILLIGRQVGIFLRSHERSPRKGIEPRGKRSGIVARLHHGRHILIVGRGSPFAGHVINPECTVAGVSGKYDRLWSRCRD